ncbi:uncharacterized protein LOC135288961 [Passer domesticus]|uniref:uncharacterized protein LOC135288961 n=1 Tax=Passer domesticus TaxID=48849 RepID=UPI0030FE176E
MRRRTEFFLCGGTSFPLGGFSVSDASLIDLLVWARIHEFPMGTATAFDLGRCQELCGLLAEEFYRGDDAVPPLMAMCDYLWAALRDREGGSEIGSLRGGSRLAICAGFSPPPVPGGLALPLVGGWGWGFAATEVTCFPAPAAEEPGFSQPTEAPPFPTPPAFWGSAFSQTTGLQFLTQQPPAKLQEGVGSASASVVAKTPQIAPPASSLSAMEPVQLHWPRRSSMLVGGSPLQPVLCSQPVFSSFSMAPAQMATAVTVAPAPSLRMVNHPAEVVPLPHSSAAATSGDLVFYTSARAACGGDGAIGCSCATGCPVSGHGSAGGWSACVPACDCPFGFAAHSWLFGSGPFC